MPSTVGSACREAGQRLARAGIEAASLEAQILMAFAIGKPREYILVHPDEELSQQSAAVFESFLERRLANEPIAYIVGHKEFFGHRFLVSPAVLVPRPETELVVELALDYLDKLGTPARVHDTCTGSGCIGISIAHAKLDAEVSFSDISEAALAVCRANARTILGRDIPVLKSDLLAGVPGLFHCILANPPYVTTEFTNGFLSTGTLEPRLALDGGADGLALYRRLIPQAFSKLVGGGMLIVEIGEEQGEAVRDLYTQGGFVSVMVHKDLAGHDRVVTGVRP